MIKLEVDAGDNIKLIRLVSGPLKVLRQPQPGRKVNVHESMSLNLTQNSHIPCGSRGAMEALLILLGYGGSLQNGPWRKVDLNGLLSHFFHSIP